MAEKRRAARIKERIFEELSIAMSTLRDPRLVNVTLTRVELPDDLQLATAYVSTGLGVNKAHPKDVKIMLRALDAAKGRLRSSVGATLGLRYTPDLRFMLDDGMDAKTRVESLLREISVEREKSEKSETLGLLVVALVKPGESLFGKGVHVSGEGVTDLA